MRSANTGPFFHREYLLLTGAIGVAFYLTHVILGGILWKGYDHLMQPISDLTASGAPDRALLQTLAYIYAIFCILFASLLAVHCRKHMNKTTLTGSILFLAMHLVSITYGLFPQDLPGSEMTLPGVMHLVVTAAIIPLTIAAPLLMGIGMVREKNTKAFGVFSMVCGILIFLFGGTTAFFFANRLPFFGLIERLNIGTLQTWTVAASVYFYLVQKKNASKENA